METQKNDEKNIVLELKRQLGRMMVQVDYMYRNDREMSRLDLDILMERTRDIYNILCDYQADRTDFEYEKPEVFEKEINEGGEMIKHNVELEINEPETSVESNEDTHTETVDNEVDEDWEDDDDQMFHVEPVEEKHTEEDNSLAAQLQRTHVNDIRMALGINDKVMIINELFRGSVERYNKSIDALNDFPTLSGARVYMSELQIELQWDTESQAYKMLNDLVERRFI